MGLNTLVVGQAYAAGPSIAALIPSLASWPWLFAINVPFGGLAFLVAWPALPDSVRSRHRVDPIEVLLNVVAFAALVYALGEAAQLGSALPALAAIAGWLLVRSRISRARWPRSSTATRSRRCRASPCMPMRASRG